MLSSNVKLPLPFLIVNTVLCCIVFLFWFLFNMISIFAWQLGTKIKLVTETHCKWDSERGNKRRNCQNLFVIETPKSHWRNAKGREGRMSGKTTECVRTFPFRSPRKSINRGSRVQQKGAKPLLVSCVIADSC